MDFNEMLQKIINYYHANTVAAILIAAIVLFLLFKKPKLLLLLIFLGIAAIGILFIISKLESTGLEHKKIPFIE
jgi:uncharacterized membrane protein YccC